MPVSKKALLDFEKLPHQNEMRFRKSSKSNNAFEVEMKKVQSRSA
jgi:hypothetical protein